MKEDKKPTKSTVEKTSSKKPKVKANSSADNSSEKSSLSFGTTRGKIEKILIGVLVTVLAFFFVKTALWEYYYYDEKEGSTVLKSSQIPLPRRAISTKPPSPKNKKPNTSSPPTTLAISQSKNSE